jgi:hypothetical protein
MTQVLIEWDGREWAVDTEEITLKQAFVIKDTTKDDANWPAGRPLQPWLAGVGYGDPACLRGLYWLMLQQDGQEKPIRDLDFPVLKYHTAWQLASTRATADAGQLRQLIDEVEKTLGPMREALAAAEAREAAAAAAADGEAERPTRRPGTASRPSPAPA